MVDSIPDEFAALAPTVRCHCGHAKQWHGAEPPHACSLYSCGCKGYRILEETFGLDVEPDEPDEEAQE